MAVKKELNQKKMELDVIKREHSRILISHTYGNVNFDWTHSAAIRVFCRVCLTGQ